MFLWNLLLIFSAIYSNEALIFSNEEIFKPIQNLSKFENDRKNLINYEFSKTLGYNLTLNPSEKIVNEIITKYKLEEINNGFIHPEEFVPSFRLFESLEKINNSKLFQTIKSMPKAGILHIHSSAMGSTKIFVELTYKEHCWICFRKDQNLEFKFSKEKPNNTDCCNSWELMSEYRKNGNQSQIDGELAEKFMFTSKNNFTDINHVWNDFENLFDITGGLISYKESFLEYLEKSFQEVLNDGVQYVELRTSLSGLYDLDGNRHSRSDTAKLLQEFIENFKKKNPRFIGAKVIMSRSRQSDPLVVEKFLDEMLDLQNKFPDLICGFDLVGQEDEGRPLKDFLLLFLKKSKQIDYFFHAGETNWYGTQVDENLVDAILLGTKRIGHGYALNKHPELAKLVKERDICLEVSPVSHQILHLVKDQRNHPLAYFLANNFPMVISSDDPSFFGADPLSHDFYITFLGIASARADLRMLKQLAYNSIKYSCMNPKLKEVAFQKWTLEWDTWIQEIVFKQLEKYKRIF